MDDAPNKLPDPIEMFRTRQTSELSDLAEVRNEIRDLRSLMLTLLAPPEPTDTLEQLTRALTRLYQLLSSVEGSIESLSTRLEAPQSPPGLAELPAELRNLSDRLGSEVVTQALIAALDQAATVTSSLAGTATLVRETAAMSQSQAAISQRRERRLLALGATAIGMVALAALLSVWWISSAQNRLGAELVADQAHTEAIGAAVGARLETMESKIDAKIDGLTNSRPPSPPAAPLRTR